MRPTVPVLLLVLLTSAAFTALVASGALGIAWLFIGPAVAGAIEIVVSHFPLGPGVSAEDKPQRAPSLGA
jgi:hypothetical protein